MNRWLRVFLGVTLAALFFCSLILFRRPPDPMFEGRFASQWAEDLLSANYQTRAEAQTAFQFMGESGVPQIRVMLQRNNAAWQEHLPRLNSILPYLNYRIVDAGTSRQRGAEMIGLLGSRGAAAIPDLIECLGKGPAAAESERALFKVGRGAVTELRGALEHRNPKIRESAARLLKEFAPFEAETVEALVKRARDREGNVRRQVAITLSYETEHSGRVVGKLLELAKDRAPAVRAAAFESLGKLRIRTAETVSALRDGLRDEAAVGRLHAAKALWLMEADAERVVPVLTALLQSREGWQAAYALGEIGAAADEAVPALIEVLREERVPRPYRTPPSSALALGRIGEAAIPALAEELNNSDERIRMSAVMAFGFMGARGKSAVPQLLRLLNDRNAEVRHATALTLAGMGAEPEEIVRGLSDCLNAEDIFMRSAAVAILTSIAPSGNWVAAPE